MWQIVAPTRDTTAREAAAVSRLATPASTTALQLLRRRPVASTVAASSGACEALLRALAPELPGGIGPSPVLGVVRSTAVEALGASLALACAPIFAALVDADAAPPPGARVVVVTGRPVAAVEAASLHAAKFITTALRAVGHGVEPAMIERTLADVICVVSDVLSVPELLADAIPSLGAVGAVRGVVLDALHVLAPSSLAADEPPGAGERRQRESSAATCDAAAPRVVRVMTVMARNARDAAATRAAARGVVLRQNQAAARVYVPLPISFHRTGDAPPYLRHWMGACDAVLWPQG